MSVLVSACGPDDGEVAWFADEPTHPGGRAPGREPEPPPGRRTPSAEPLDLESGSITPKDPPLEPDPIWPDPVFGSLYCGDNVRGDSEECDSGKPNDFCTLKCRSRDALAFKPLAGEANEPAPALLSVSSFDAALVPGGRSLGEGPHAIAAGPGGFAVTYVDLEEAEPSVRIALYEPDGDRLEVYSLGDPFSFSDYSDPVVAALPDGTFAVAWAAFDAPGDDDELGVLVQRVDPESGPLGSPIPANSTVVGAQHGPDMVWTEGGLIVAWTDDSSVETGPDLRYRRFTSELGIASGEGSLATTAMVEGGVSLLPFDGGWAAAFRTGQPYGRESVVVSTEGGTFIVPDVFPGAAGDRPALAELDATHLLLVFTEGSDPEGSGVLNTGRLRYAVVDTSGPSTLAPTALAPLEAPYASDATIAQSQPSAVRSGDAVYVAWRSSSLVGSALQEEVWLKRVPVNGAALDWSKHERALQISNLHRYGDQRAPKLAAKASGEILATWTDYGKNMPGSTGPDVVAELRSFVSDHCFGFEQQNTPPFSLGMPVIPDGTAARPYPLCTVGQLQHVIDTPSLQNKQFILQADLDLAELVGSFGASSPFTGTFDGADYSLANYTRLMPGLDGVGLFEEIQGDSVADGVTDGIVRNLVLVDPVIDGLAHVGAVAGRVLANGKLENVHVVGGTVASHGARAGGIAGDVLGRIVDSTSSASVAGVGGSASMLGGLAGEITATGAVIESSATGAVSGATTHGGGLVGRNLGIISRSWASGAVGGTSQVGGLVGTNSLTIGNSYARGAVTGSCGGALIGQTETGSNVSRSYGTGFVANGTNVGGLTGFQNGSATYTAVIWNSTVNAGRPAVGNLGSAPSGVLSRTTVQMKQAATYVSQTWDFVNLWGISENNDYPVLLEDGFDFCLEVPQQSTPPFAVGFGATGTEANPYPLCTLGQMQHVANTSSLYDDHYRLMGDINLSGMTGTIGTTSVPFRASFDGNGRRLSNYVRNTTSSTVGLFSSVLGGTIKNLTIEGFDVRGGGTVGGLAGLVQPGEGRPALIDNVHVLTSTVRPSTGSVSTIGGLVGRLTGQVNASTASVTITNNSQTGITRMGGLVGHLDLGGSIRLSASTGGVTNGANVGGLVGHLTGGVIEDSFSSSTVQTNQTNVGGLVGYGTRSGLASSVLTRSYATGPVTATGSNPQGSYVGGLVGYADPAIIRDSYATGAVSGSTVNVGGLVGRARGGTVILRSHAMGNVSGAGPVGGLIGEIFTDVSGQAVAVNVNNSYARGNATKTTTGSQGTGGLIGAIAGFPVARLTNSYASGTQSSPSSTALGGLIGNAVVSPICTAPIWNTTARPTGIGSGSCTGAAFGHTATQLRQQATYTSHGWDFTTLWTIDEGVSFATLRPYAPTLSSLLIDDLEDGDAQIVAQEGRLGNWYTYNDGTGGGTQSPTTATFVGQSPGRDEAFAARTNGSGFTNWGAGLGVNFSVTGSTKNLYDASAYGGVTFWARAASSLSVRFGVPDGNTDTAGGVCSNCSDHFGANLALTTTWQQFSFTWTQLQQQGWGDDEVALDPERLYGLIFQAGPSTSFDIWIDDVAFLPLDQGDPILTTELIDDLEDGNRLILASGGRMGPWYTFNDGTSGATQTPAAGGQSFLPMSPGFSSTYAARTYGSGFTNWGAGIALNLNDDELPPRSTYNASAFDGISFWARANDAINVRFNVSDRNTDQEGGVCTTCFDHFGADVVFTTGWQHFTFSWAELDQIGWGNNQPAIDPAQLYAILFQTPANQSFDIQVDDVAFFAEP